MIIVKNKKYAMNFRTFGTYRDAVEFLEMIPRKYRIDYEIVKPQRNPIDILKVR